MFEILFRITDDLAEWEEDFEPGDDISGFFAINVNGYHYGHYHNYPLQPGERDYEYITHWFLSLISAYQELTRSGYILLSNMDSPNSWIEFRKIQDTVEINLIDAKKPNGTTDLRLTPLDEFKYGKWYIQYFKDSKHHSELVDRRNESVKLSRFRAELIRKASQYLEELCEFNPQILNNKPMSELASLIPSL